MIMQPESQPDTVTGRPATGAPRDPRDTILLVSFADRDALASDLTDAGFRVVASRRTEQLVKRFLALDCALIILDARSAIDEAKAAAQLLAGQAAAREARLLLLYDRADAEHLAPFAACGISAMLPAPWHREELSLAIALARRQARQPEQDYRPIGQLWWHADLADGAIHLEAASERPLPGFDVTDGLNLHSLLRSWPAADRRRAFGALRQLQRHGGYAAFSHQLATAREPIALIHHLSLSTGRIIGHIEWQLAHTNAEDGQSHPGARRLPTLAEGLRAFRLSGKLESHATMAIGCAVEGVGTLRATLGDAAAGGLIEHLAHGLAQALRRDFGYMVTLCADAPDGFSLLVVHGADPDRVEMECRLTADAIARTMLLPVHPDALLLLAVDKHVRERPAQAIAAALQRRLRQAPAVQTHVDLPANLALDQVEVRLQPQFSVVDGSLAGAEALARWHHPRLGVLGGATLIGAAIACGQQLELSRHIWALTMQAMAQWPDAMRHLRVALNATSADIAAPDAAPALLGMAAAAGVAPSRLTIEVTEGMAIASPQTAAQTLRALRAAGMHVALDDFGTGFSGLAWLRQLPVDYIKVDAAFVRDAADSERAATLLAGILDHVRQQNVDVLAEGVEDDEQLALVTGLGCRWYQGYLRAAAMPADEFVAFALGARSGGPDPSRRAIA